MRSSASLLALLGVLGGCGDDEGNGFDPVDGACGSLETPATPEPVAEACFAGDTGCPAEAPEVGSSCGSDFRSCVYETVDGSLDCADGRWTHEGEYPGDYIPPFAETCLDPFEGTLSGAEILLGPSQAGPFRPFADCEEYRLEWGPQGGAMVPFELRVVGEDVPECVIVETRLSVGDHVFDGTGNRVALHCGESLLVYTVIPWDLQSALCTAPDVVVMKLEVTVQGIGSTFARVQVPSPGECGEPELG